jgi:radical SAM superfamily enzyme YgiQ (UPF0313 family)
MRILLVKPQPQLLVAKRLQEGFLHLEPLELEIVAGGVPEEDEVTICDLGIEKKPIRAFRNQLKRIRPQIVGFTAYSSQSGMVKRLAQIVKKYDPVIINIVGGIHATIIPADYAGDNIDIIVRGEGGTAFREIVSRFRKGLPLDFGQISLSPQDPGFHEKAAAPPPEYPRAEDIPRPRRDLVQRSRYFCIWTSTPENKLETIFPQTASFRTSIGCAFRCSFCVVHHIMRGKYLQRSPEDVVDEIGSLKEKFVYFVDDETFLNKKRMTEIAKLLLQRGIKKQYISWARSDTIVRHPELFRLWKDAGLSTVYVGLEAMTGKRLDNYNKGTSVETNRKAISILREIGIILHASFIVDPDFSVDDFGLLEEEVKKVCPAEVSFTVFSPPPGTELWNKYKEDYICDSYLFYDCMHTILPTRLKLKKFYKHFARLTSIALKGNPTRAHNVMISFRDAVRVIYRSSKYTSSLKKIYRDY